jgi:acetyl esterase/lipase
MVMRLRVKLRCLLPIVLLCGCAQPGMSADGSVHHDIAYKSGGDLSEYERERARLDLYLPDGASEFPTIVWFHGGGLTGGDKGRADHVALASSLAARGIAVAAVNYRLSPRATFPAYVEDAAASVAWVLDNIGEHGGDTRNVFVSGHSAGGYLVAMIGVDQSYLEAYGYGFDDLAGMIPISGQMIVHETVRAERGLQTNRPLVDGAAPVFNVTADAPPFLSIAGSQDLPARSAENRYFIEALKAVDHPDAEFIEFAGRNHSTIMTGIQDPQDAVGTAMLDFIEQHMR